MNWWPIAAGILNWLGGQGDRNAASSANALAERQFALVEPYTRRQFERREKIFEPIEEEAMQRTAGRMRATPWYADDWLASSRGLRKPMKITY